MTIQQRARELCDALEQRQKADGKRFYCLKEGSPDWMVKVIAKIHKDIDDRLPDDSIYKVIKEISAVLADADPDADPWELIVEIEPDVYTSDLTAWLHENANNVYYLTQALEEGEIKDGFQLLSRAQYLFKQEVANALLSLLEESE